jgi:hypothetical protein
MNEFNNRIDAQREALRIINTKGFSEPLFGLSSGAIERWMKNNGISERVELIQDVRNVADKLFFLSNKSQEQITDEYKSLSEEVANLILKLNNT